MTELLLLSPAEVAALTGKVRRGAQIRALRGMGIEHKARPDGTVVVLRSHVELVLGGGGGGRIKKTSPNWGPIATS